MENGMLFELARDYLLYSTVLSQKDEESQARENLTKAIDTFKECGADGWVEKYENEMAAL
jgi:hypothetical protein